MVGGGAESTGYTVLIGEQSLEFPLRLSIDNLLVLDEHRDTMIQSRHVATNVRLLSLLTGDVGIGGVSVDQAYYRMLSKDSSMLLTARLRSFSLSRSRYGLLSDHIDRHVKHDGRLLTVAGAGIDLCFPLIIVDEHVQRQRRAQLLRIGSDPESFPDGAVHPGKHLVHSVPLRSAGLRQALYLCNILRIQKRSPYLTRSARPSSHAGQSRTKPH